MRRWTAGCWQATDLNQFINVAVAEKLAALRPERYFRDRAGRADSADFLANLEKAGTDIALPAGGFGVDGEDVV